MVTLKNLIQNSKTDLGWNTRDADYTSWRNAVKDYYALIIAARSLTGFRSSMRNRLAGGSKSYKKALEALLQDCLKKHSETSKNLAIKHAQKRAHDHENSDEEDDISNTGEAAGTAVAFWIWNERDRRRLGVIQTMTLDGIWDIVKAHVPADRKVREILAALRDSNPPNLSFPTDYTGLHSDAEVKAFFRMSKSDPVRLMVLLHSIPPRANTPPKPILTSNLRSLSPGTNMKILPKILMRMVRSSPPPLSASRGRLHTHTMFGTINVPSDGFSLDSEDHNIHQEDGPDCMAKKPSRVGPRSRSFFTILEQYKELTT
ncbi:hypothetical protein BGX38DRAFT_1279217 [Terfezia claveryi]|nr:hypothetical protein BGX38DRAFT_1279217 [Terfezia claveryi]